MNLSNSCRKPQRDLSKPNNCSSFDGCYPVLNSSTNPSNSCRRPQDLSNSTLSRVHSRAYKILISNNTKNPYIECMFQNRLYRFLIDTGASVSLLKYQRDIDFSTINLDSDDKIILTGLSANSPVETAGSCVINLIMDSNNIRAKFHLVKENHNLPHDGILGNDFLSYYGATINLDSSELSLKPFKNPIKIICNPKNENTQTLFLEPRSETVIEIDVLNKNITEGICPELIIADGVYLAKSIVKVENGKAITTALNTQDRRLKINELKLFLEPFDSNSSRIFYTQKEELPINIQSRIKLLHENLRLGHLNPQEKRSVLDICDEYNDIFYLPNDELTCTNLLKHEIKVTDSTPISSKIYRFPEIHKKELDKQINKMLKQGIIKNSVSPYNSPLWIVPKKRDASGEQKWRIVVDFRKLNDVTVGDAFPLPNIEEILDQLGHSKYFTTLDLASGFHQIQMKPEDVPKTAFSTPSGHYEFLRMPFGLKNAPATFQRLMTVALSGLQGLQCFIYLDDVVIFASTVEEHSQRLCNIFERLRNNNLLLQPDKCEFMHKEVAYLGHIISDKGISPNPEKVKAIKDYPIPQNPKQIKQFLGLIGYYRRFIKDFSKFAKPLTVLLKKDVSFNWSSEQDQSIEYFKAALTQAPILQYPDFSREFLLTTDASNYAIGAILSQGEVGKDLPIAFASRTLNKAECNYSTIERELLAIIWAAEHFRPYLYGRKFTILTDHRPLTWLFNCRNPNSRLIRWRLRLEEFTYEIRYKPGRVNSNVDALSRNPVQINNVASSTHKYERYSDFVKYHYENQSIPDVKVIKDNLFLKFPNALIYSKDLDENNIYAENLSTTYDLSKLNEDSIQLYDAIALKSENKTTFLLISKLNHFDRLTYNDLFYSLQKLRSSLNQNNITEIYLKNPIEENTHLKQNMFNEMLTYLFSKTKIKITLVDRPRFTPKSREEIKNIFRENHESSLAGHAGFLRTYRRIKENYKWTNMKSDIKNLIRHCQSCQTNKHENKTARAPMEITTTSERPFQRLAIDVVGPLDLTENGNKFIVTMQDDLTKYSYAVPVPNHEAKTIANELLKFITIFGIPECILSDNGADFTSNTVKELNKLFKIKHIFSSPYHPQTNGALERSHLTLKEYLKHYINERHTDWDEYVPLAMFSYNTHFHKTTNYTPHELLFGQKAVIPNTLTCKPEFKYTYEDYYSNLKLKLQKSFQIARENIIKSKENSKVNYDKKLNKFQYKVGDQVLVQNKNLKPGISKKLQPNYKGPYKIQKLFPNQTVKVLLKNNKTAVYHHNLLKPFFSDDNENQN